jgi:hypothetical protein
MQSSQNLSYLAPFRPKYLLTEITQNSLHEVIDCFWNYTYRGTTSRKAHTFLHFSCFSVSRNSLLVPFTVKPPTGYDPKSISCLNNEPQTSYSDSQEDAFKKGTKIMYAFIVGFPELQTVC